MSKSRWLIPFLLIVSGLASLFANPTFASVASQPDLPWKNMFAIGQAKLRVAVWDIYQAELFAETAEFNEQRPFALRLTYLRPITREALIEETKKQWQKTTRLEQATIDNWAKQLESALPGVRKGDSITLFVDAERSAHFYLNDEFYGRVADVDFSSAFAGIWLAPETTRPDLREQLLGLR